MKEWVEIEYNYWKKVNSRLRCLFNPYLGSIFFEFIKDLLLSLPLPRSKERKELMNYEKTIRED
jgi:hypothetical protein